MNNVKPAPGFIDRSRATQLLEKWAPVLDYTSDKVSPIEDEHARLSTAMLMENQERWCLEESGNSYAGGALGSASGGTIYNPPGSVTSRDSYAANDARLPKVLIPMVRRTFPELITNEIVGVQPMSGPVGLAFALRYRYEADSLGANGVDGYSTGATQQSNTYVSRAAADEQELGYQYLDTRFTGTSAASLSGNSSFSVIGADQGVAALLSQFELTGNIPQVTVEFSKTAVEAGTRRLAARWSVELEQDLKNMNGLDIDSELTNTMSYEIQAEIDREMVIRMIQVCLKYASYGSVTSWTASAADGRWLAERNRDFYQKLIVEANRIAVRNRRGAANFIIATPRVCAILEALPEFSWMTVDGNVNTQPTGVAKVGTVGGRFQVYRDTRTDAQNLTGQRTTVEYALLGYKGPEFYDTGIIYCPYIPVMVQRTIGPNDFAPRVGLLTRYGVVDNIFGANLYYTLVVVKGLGIAFTPATSVVYF